MSTPSPQRRRARRPDKPVVTERVSVGSLAGVIRSADSSADVTMSKGAAAVVMSHSNFDYIDIASAERLRYLG